MSRHYNIQISIQEVHEPEKVVDTSGYPIKVAGRETITERKVTEVLKIALTAASEQEAYAKAHRLLAVNAPEPEAPKPHLHRASCDDSIGNLVCGYPAGPTILDRPI